MAAFAVTWESFCAGHTVFHFGRSGALVVAQVIVADMSDLSWRGFFTWGLEFGQAFWIWTIPVVEKLVTGKLGWYKIPHFFYGYLFTWAYYSFMCSEGMFQSGFSSALLSQLQSLLSLPLTFFTAEHQTGDFSLQRRMFTGILGGV